MAKTNIDIQKAYSRQELLLQRFQGMVEADFTKSVLVPLFMKMGYAVDYYGGPAEGGKDLILSREEDFGSRELAVVQVKKTKASAAAASSSSFPGIVNQLQQASEKRICLKSGDEQLPSRVYFVTPYQLDTRALESRFEKYQELAARRVRVLDGVVIATEIQKLLPELADDLCGAEFSIKYNLLSNISNADLLSALNYSKVKNVNEFYCDLDFGVGRVTSKLFFSLKFSPFQAKFTLPVTKWGSFEQCVRRVKDRTGVDLVVGGVNRVIDMYADRNRLWLSKQNQKILADISKAISEIETLLAFVLDECREIILDALILSSDQHVFSSKKTKKLSEDEIQRLERIKEQRENIEADFKRLVDRTSFDEFEVELIGRILGSVESQLQNLRMESAILNSAAAPRLNAVLRSMASLNKLNDLVKASIARRVDEPMFDFEVDGNALSEQLIRYREFINNGIKRLSSGDSNREEIKNYFLQCQQIFALVAEILEEKALVEAAGLDKDQKFSLTEKYQRIHLPLKEVFSTGIHCTVLGEAGAGKSTTLYRYAVDASAADRDDEITLFLPLTRLLSNRSPQTEDESIPPTERLEVELSKFLNVGNKIAPSEILQFLKSKRRVTFVFDGVDEVIKTCPWVIDAIRGVPASYKNCQIIISCRSSGAYIDSLDYLCLTLLPFTAEQVNAFVEGWFVKKPPLSSLVIAHLNDTPTLAEIVTNPLLATVLCVLAENEVPLPKGELGMYAERMKLLLGHYDIHKKSKRLSIHHTVLEAVARKLAYQLHRNGIRSLPPEELETIAVSNLRNSGANDDQLRVAVRELCDPCNVLVPMTDDGAFGFGHLRFQEYLCATELCQNRGIDLLPFLTSPWWRSVLVLFARLTDDIRHVIEDVISRQHNVTKYQETLFAIIATRPKDSQRDLQRLVEKHMRMDSIEQDLKEFNEFDSELDDLSEYRSRW